MKGTGPVISKGRRGLLAHIGAGAGVAAVLLSGPNSASALPAKTVAWQPARHAQDNWLDQIPGEHRVVFDTTSPEGLAEAMQYAENYFIANEAAYGLKASDLAVVIIVRHRSTPFGFTDAVWAKYGKELSDQAEFSDPKVGEPFMNRLDIVLERLFTRVSLKNVYAASARGSGGKGRMDNLIQKGVHFAVCGMSTESVCGEIARATGARAGVIFEEFSANLIPNGRLVSAGIVAANRAQERGYSYIYTA